MAGTVRVDPGELTTRAVHGLGGPQGRSSDNNANFEADRLSMTTAGSVLRCQEVLAELKDRLGQYNEILSEDKATLASVAADAGLWDSALARELAGGMPRRNRNAHSSSPPAAAPEPAASPMRGRRTPAAAKG